MVQDGAGIGKVEQFGQRFMTSGLGHIINNTECNAKGSRLYSIGIGTVKVFEKIYSLFWNSNLKIASRLRRSPIPQVKICH